MSRLELMQAEGTGGGSSGPWRITFDTNPDDCNLACVMCEEHSDLSERKRLRVTTHAAHRRMDIVVIRRVVAEMVPRGLHEIIPSTMGEPLLYERFEEILQLCREYSLRLNLTTNGTWPRLGPARWGELLCPLSSDIKVSWNGVKPETQDTIMRGGRNGHRIDDLRTFVGVRDEVAASDGQRCRLTLQCTFMEDNLTELPALIDMAASLGVDRVKGHHLWVHFEGMAQQSLRRNLDARRRWNRAVGACFEAAESHRRPDGTRVVLDNFLPLPEEDADFPSHWACPFLGREAWVNHAGRFDPCCAPDAERQSLGYFGRVLDPGGVGAIWDGPAYRALRADYLTHPVCQKCTMRRPPETLR